MPGVDHERRDVVEVLAVDVEDVGAVLGEQSGARRPGQDAGQVEHPHPAQRAEPSPTGTTGPSAIFSIDTRPSGAIAARCG